MARHGTRTKFNQGCTDGLDGTACEPCRQANNEYFKKRNQDKNAEKYGSVTPISKPSESAPEIPLIGASEQAVIDTLDGNATALKRPDLVTSARAMARLLDNPLFAAQQTAAAKQLREIMAELLKGSEKKGRLAAVRQMSRPDSATG